jgi:hypothetical protein
LIINKGAEDEQIEDEMDINKVAFLGFLAHRPPGLNGLRKQPGQRLCREI